uniref:Sodium/calcium exchanger membrane region domain-containing protein n=1 Tax=Arcella intermedia TaxID=1963864 RepID=A0A6B2L1M2_9EUKA
MNASQVDCDSTGWCNGISCTCSLYPSTNSLGSMLIMILFYGAILGFGAKIIADGSELLLEIFPNWSTLIGGLLLPVLGALPDSTMIVFSGAFGSVEEAQTQVSVGVGTLAGSTIMLLTIPWSASLIAARTDIINNKAKDRKLTKSLWGGLFTTGASVDKDTMKNAKIALFTSLSFLIVQIVAFVYLGDPTGNTAKRIEGYVSLAGFVLCMVLFVAYCAYQIIIPKLVEKRKARAEQNAAERKIKLQALLVIEKLRKSANLNIAGLKQQEPEKPPEITQERSEALALAMGSAWRNKAAGLIKRRDNEEKEQLIHGEGAQSDSEQEDSSSSSEGGKDEPFSKVLAKSIFLMAIGTFLVAFFSDPMVDVITEFGLFINVPAFYVSFVITPFCSNASELIASIIFATKKTKKSSSMTYSQLYGAATMNSTLGLGIFYAIIYFRGLAWTFSAETISILFVVWAVCIVGSFKKTFSIFWCLPNLLLYPLSLFLVYALETFLHWT